MWVPSFSLFITITICLSISLAANNTVLESHRFSPRARIWRCNAEQDRIIAQELLPRISRWTQLAIDAAFNLPVTGMNDNLSWEYELSRRMMLRQWFGNHGQRTRAVVGQRFRDIQWEAERSRGQPLGGNHFGHTTIVCINADNGLANQVCSDPSDAAVNHVNMNMIFLVIFSSLFGSGGICYALYVKG